MSLLTLSRTLGRTVSPRKICSSPKPLVPVNVALLGNGVFADVVKMTPSG